MKKSPIIGWGLTWLVGLFMIGASAIPKWTGWPGRNEMMAHLGIPLALLPMIGLVEVAVTAIYLIPRTSFLGAILMTGYLGGAVMIHVRIGDAWYFPLIVGVVAWVGLALRRPEIIRLALGTPRAGGTLQETCP